MAIINFNISDIWRAMPDHYYEAKCAVSGWDMAWKICNSDQIQNGRLSAIINCNMPDIWKPNRLLLWNKMCGFREGYALTTRLVFIADGSCEIYAVTNLSSIKFKMAHYCKTGKDAAWKCSFTWAGRGIVMAGWPLVKYCVAHLFTSWKINKDEI